MPNAHETALRRIGGSRALQLGLCLALGAAASLALGQDASFDLRNYHLYNAYAFLNWRYGKDFLPAAMQTYFHPFADLPYYALALGALAGSPRALAACQGLYFGGLLYASWRFNEVFLEQRLAVLATLIGATAVGTVSEIGTTFNDIQVAALVVAAVVVLLNASGRTSWALAAGLLFGGAVVVKLYAVFYAIAALGAMLVVHGRSAARAVLWALAGATVAVCTLYGWWAWWVWSQTGNPVFPYFNTFFESPLFPRENYSANFAGWEPYHSLMARLRWAIVQRDAVAELRFRDPRLLAGFAAAAVVALALAGGGLPTSSQGSGGGLSESGIVDRLGSEHRAGDRE